jgi:hypothetical protein
MCFLFKFKNSHKIWDPFRFGNFLNFEIRSNFEICSKLEIRSNFEICSKFEIPYVFKI